MRLLLYKIRVLLSVNYGLMLEYRAELFLWVLASVMPFIMLGAWTKAATRGAIGMTAAELGHYFVAVFLVRQLSVIWFIYEFEFHIVEGRLAGQLLRPMNPLWNFVAAHLGEQLARLPFTALLVTVVLLAWPDARWVPRPASVIVGLFAIYFSFTLRFALQYCFAMLGFWFERASAIEQLAFLPYLYLSGILAPLNLYPDAVRRVAEWTPFPYMVYFPAQILTGTALTHGPAYVAERFAIMGLWTVALCLLGAALWKRGLHHFSGMGA